MQQLKKGGGEIKAQIGPSNVYASKLSVIHGQQIQQEYPQVADMYRSGMSMPDIADFLELPEKRNITRRIAINSVLKALHGHDGSGGLPTFEGLLGHDELKGLARSSNRASAQRVGAMMAQRKTGVCGLPKALRIEIGKRAGKTSFLRKVGVHGLSLEQRQQTGRMAALRRGEVPWIQATEDRESEFDFILRKAKEPALQYHSGGNIGRPILDLLVSAVNCEYHGGEDIRSNTTVRSALYVAKKRMAQQTKLSSQSQG